MPKNRPDVGRAAKKPIGRSRKRALIGVIIGGASVVIVLVVVVLVVLALIPQFHRIFSIPEYASPQSGECEYSYVSENDENICVRRDPDIASGELSVDNPPQLDPAHASGSLSVADGTTFTVYDATDVTFRKSVDNQTYSGFPVSHMTIDNTEGGAWDLSGVELEASFNDGQLVQGMIIGVSGESLEDKPTVWARETVEVVILWMSEEDQDVMDSASVLFPDREESAGVLVTVE